MQFPWVPKHVALYRHYDADGRLLYVGVSGNPVQRLKQHRYSNAWIRLSVRMHIEWFSNSAEAAIAELHAINNEKPLHNKPARIGPQNARAEPTIMLSIRVPERLAYQLEYVCKTDKIKKSDFIRNALEKALNGS